MKKDRLEGVAVSPAERTLCINEANLSGNQNGGGTPGRGGAFSMSHQNATKPSSPSGVSWGHLGTGVYACVCVSERTRLLCLWLSAPDVCHF